VVGGVEISGVGGEMNDLLIMVGRECLCLCLCLLLIFDDS